MVELADTTVSNTVAARRGGSIPSTGTHARIVFLVHVVGASFE